MLGKAKPTKKIGGQPKATAQFLIKIENIKHITIVIKIHLTTILCVKAT
jgi:hypothetical protein